MSWFYYEEEKNKKISLKCLRICGGGREGRGRGIFLHRSVLFYSKGKKIVTKVSHTGIFPAPDTRLFPVFLSNGWRKRSMSGSYLFSFFQVCFYFVIFGSKQGCGGRRGNSCSLKRAILSAFLSLFYLDVFCSTVPIQSLTSFVSMLYFKPPSFFVNFLCFSLKKKNTIYMSLHAVWNF